MPKVVDHDARRLEISGVAALLISRGGLEAATIREIAHESGFSKSVIGHYFDSKEELIDGALTWANRQYENRVAKATRGLRGLSAMRRRIDAIVPVTKAMRDEWKVRLVFWSAAAIDPGLRKRQQRRFNLTVDLFENDLLDAVADDGICLHVDSRTEARHLVNSIVGMSTAALHNPSLYTRGFLHTEINVLLDRYTDGRERLSA